MIVLFDVPVDHLAGYRVHGMSFLMGSADTVGHLRPRTRSAARLHHFPSADTVATFEQVVAMQHYSADKSNRIRIENAINL